MEYEDISFTTKDNINIAGWFIPSDTANATIVIGHGYPFDKANILPAVTFLHPEYNLLLYDHRSFGMSSGLITTVGHKETEDVKASVQFAKKKTKQPVALYGFSMSASAMLLSQTDVAAIIADSPYASLDNMVKQTYRMFGPFRYPFVWLTHVYTKIAFGIYPKDVSVVESVQNKTTPILLIHGSKDTQIPVQNAYFIKESNPKIDLWVIEGADHLQSVNDEQYKKRVKEFLKNSLKK